MSRTFIVSGTDTGVGKTAVSALLSLNLNAHYWKPIQSGVADGADTQSVKTMTGLPDARFLPEACILQAPLSPHRAAELEGRVIDAAAIVPPPCDGTLIVEGAGGLLAPVTREILQIELFRRWGAPVILCARTALGTINHTLLSVEALRARDMRLHGVVFVGDDNPDTIRTVADFSGARVLGRLPWLERLDAASLRAAFAQHFRSKDFTGDFT